MLFRNKKEQALLQGTEPPLHAHKYAIHFELLEDAAGCTEPSDSLEDIQPDMPYLNTELCSLIAELLPLFQGFPKHVWISQQRIEEGHGFCRVVFWTFAASADAIKTFAIWFQAIFRDSRVTETLERLVACALEETAGFEIALTDWLRLPATKTDIEKAVATER